MNQDHICQLCGKHDYTLLYDKGRGNTPTMNYICTHCGFIFVLPRIQAADMATLYKQGGFSKQYRGKAVPSDDHLRAREPAAHRRSNLVRRLGLQSGSMLEIGCGSGNFLNVMRQKGWRCIGLEPDSQYSDYARKTFGVTIENSFFEQFATDQQFDLICSFHVIEHVPDVNEFLNKIHALLHETGVVFLEYPSIDNVYTHNIETFFWDVHINTFTNKTMRLFMQKHGFDIIEQRRTKQFCYVIARKASVKPQVVFDGADIDRIRSIIKTYRPTGVRSRLYRAAIALKRLLRGT